MVECLTFLLVTLLFSTLTFMNPYFMTKQLAKESNYVIVDRQINKKFNKLANVLEVEKKETNSALLKSKYINLIVMFHREPLRFKKS